jgi:hypothetical protein
MGGKCSRCVENPKGTSGRHVDGTIILKLILNEQDIRVRTVFIWLRIGISDGTL